MYGRRRRSGSAGIGPIRPIGPMGRLALRRIHLPLTHASAKPSGGPTRPHEASCAMPQSGNKLPHCAALLRPGAIFDSRCAPPVLSETQLRMSQWSLSRRPFPTGQELPDDFPAPPDSEIAVLDYRLRWPTIRLCFCGRFLGVWLGSGFSRRRRDFLTMRGRRSNAG